MSLISMRVTLTPQGSEAASITPSSRALISSRCESNWSRSIEPMTVRMLVITRLSSACCEIGDLVGRAPHVEHLIEGDAVDRHRRVVLGDDLLARHVDDLLHDVELAADRST